MELVHWSCPLTIWSESCPGVSTGLVLAVTMLQCSCYISDGLTIQLQPGIVRGETAS